MEQLCKSFLEEGKYDEIIREMLDDGSYYFKEIQDRIMKESRGHENPELVMKRIKYWFDVKQMQTEYFTVVPRIN